MTKQEINVLLETTKEIKFLALELRCTAAEVRRNAAEARREAVQLRNTIHRAEGEGEG